MNDVETRHKGVAYAAKHKDEMPENIKPFLKDLFGYQAAGQRLEAARSDAVKSIEKIDEQISQLCGSLDAIVRIIARELGPEKIKEFAEKLTEQPVFEKVEQKNEDKK